MWRRLVSFGLVFGLSFAPLSALPLQDSASSSSSGSVELSAEEYAEVLQAVQDGKTALETSNQTIDKQSTLLTQAENNLKASNLTIADQSKSLTKLSIFCGVLGSAVLIEALSDLIQAFKK